MHSLGTHFVGPRFNAERGAGRVAAASDASNTYGDFSREGVVGSASLMLPQGRPQQSAWSSASGPVRTQGDRMIRTGCLRI